MRRKKHNNLVVQLRRSRYLPVLAFIVKLNVFALPLYAVLLTGFTFRPLVDATTYLAFSTLRLAGVDARLNGDVISVPVEGGSFGGYVSWDSTGWKSMLALFALIFATDFSFGKKLLGLFLIPAILLVNVLRVWFMFYIATINAGYFELAHATVWSWGMIIAVLALWILWMRKM